MEKRVFHLQALSALHVGTGQGVGVVDLPIARAKASNLPLVPGSSLKGVLRDEVQLSAEDAAVLFGPDSQQEEAHAGAIAVGDANLLVLPIRSFAGTVAYTTCPFILRQYARDVATSLTTPTIEQGNAGITQTSVLSVGQSKIALEDLDLTANAYGNIDAWAQQIAQALYPDSEEWRTQFEQRFVVLPDDTFSFLADTATEVRIRIKIDDKTRTVAKGALWSEENLPADSVLWGVIGVSRSRGKVKKDAAQVSALLPAGESHMQIGGKHTVGRGLCRFVIDQPAGA